VFGLWNIRDGGSTLREPIGERDLLLLVPDASGEMTSPGKMTATALKKELGSRGLDCTGLKAVLVTRLQEAMSEGGAAGDEEEAGA